MNTMATKSKEVNPTIQIAKEVTGKEAENDGYHTISSSKTVATENPYAQRKEAVAAALGCTDTVKG